MLDTIKSNVKQRLETLKIIPTNALGVVSTIVDGTLDMKPVQALAEGLQSLGDGVLQVIDKNAEITRAWAGKIK